MARMAPEKENHFRNAFFFFSAERWAINPRMKANNTMVRMVPEANAIT